MNYCREKYCKDLQKTFLCEEEYNLFFDLPIDIILYKILPHYVYDCSLYMKPIQQMKYDIFGYFSFDKKRKIYMIFTSINNYNNIFKNFYINPLKIYYYHGNDITVRLINHISSIKNIKIRQIDNKNNYNKKWMKKVIMRYVNTHNIKNIKEKSNKYLKLNNNVKYKKLKKIKISNTVECLHFLYKNTFPKLRILKIYSFNSNKLYNIENKIIFNSFFDKIKINDKISNINKLLTLLKYDGINKLKLSMSDEKDNNVNFNMFEHYNTKITNYSINKFFSIIINKNINKIIISKIFTLVYNFTLHEFKNLILKFITVINNELIKNRKNIYYFSNRLKIKIICNNVNEKYKNDNFINEINNYCSENYKNLKIKCY